MKNLYLALFSYLLLSLPFSAHANEQTTAQAKAADAVSIVNARIREQPPGASVTALYMTIKNNSETARYLVRVESDVSNLVEVHESKMTNGMMEMGEVESITIAPNASTELKPSGYHIMLINLKKELKLGDTAAVTLVFKDGSKLTINPEVKKIKMSMH